LTSSFASFHRIRNDFRKTEISLKRSETSFAESNDIKPFELFVPAIVILSIQIFHFNAKIQKREIASNGQFTKQSRLGNLFDDLPRMWYRSAINLKQWQFVRQSRTTAAKVVLHFACLLFWGHL
jgi:hypothetical protein